MFIKFFIDYPYVVYSIIGWGYIFAFIRLKGIKRLYPVAILGALIIFIATYWLTSVGLYRFNIEFLPVLGIPFFYILWGAASGIIFAYYFGEKLIQRIISILGFSGLVVFMEYLVENVKRVDHLGKFTNYHEFVVDVFALSTLAFIMTNVFKKRMDKSPKE